MQVLRLMDQMSEFRLGRVMVLGSRGMVGSAVIRQLEKSLDVAEIIPVSREQVDLRDQRDTLAYMKKNKPDWVIVAAAKVGGIYANQRYPADFIYDNLAIELNAIQGAFESGVEKLIFLGSSCIYPKFAEQPIKETALLTNTLEATNEPYAIAKIAGIKLCESFNRQYGTDFRSLMPTNLFGPGDNYHPENSHVIPGLIRRFHEAKNHRNKYIDVWGTGRARREFLFVDDLASAVSHVMELSQDKMRAYDPLQNCSHINIGVGDDISIFELANMVKDTIGIDAELRFDLSQPDGTPRKLLDISRIKELGWCAETSLADGLRATYQSFVKTYKCKND